MMSGIVLRRKLSLVGAGFLILLSGVSAVGMAQTPSAVPPLSSPSAETEVLQPLDYGPLPGAAAPVQRKPLVAGVSKTLYLPAAMCGQWSVIGMLKQTNVPQTNPVSSNLWILANENGQVTITNPENGANASVQVTAVLDNTATFVRSQQVGSLNVSETVTITVNGDRFTGTNFSKRQYTKPGKQTSTQFALFQLEGNRIGGGGMRLRSEKPPEIRIEEPTRKWWGK